MAKRFILHESERYGDGIEDTQSDSTILIDSFYQCVEIMNQLHEENKQLKQELRFIQSELHNASFDVRERTLKEVSDAIEKIKRYE